MLTNQEIEMLAVLLQRAGVNVYEMHWANSVLDRLRTLASEQQAKDTLKQKREAQDDQAPKTD